MCKIAFIIATKDRQVDLWKLLRNLSGQSVRPDQVIIVDASTAADDSLVDDFASLNIRYIYHSQPSASAQRNKGIGVVDAEIDLIGFLDDDVILEPGAMAAMIRFWESAPADMGGCGFNLKNFEPTGMAQLKHSSVARRLGLYSPDKGIVMPSGWQTMIGEVFETTFVQWIPSTAAVWRRSILDHFKFEEHFDGYSYLEDLDFSYSVSRQYRLAVVAGAGFYHYHSPAGRIGRYMFGKIEVRNRLFFVRKHRLSVARCYLGLLIRSLMTVGRGMAYADRTEFKRAAGNWVALLQSITSKVKLRLNDRKMNRRLKVLVVAYACSPYLGSESGVGWGWVNAIAKYHDAYIITAEFHREDIEKYFVEMPAHPKNLHFFYVPPKPWHYSPSKGWLLVERSFLKPLVNLSYRLWQRDAYKMAVRLHMNESFDLMHLVTLVGFRFPGLFWKIKAPFVWGPIGGLENTPWKFLPGMGVSGCMYYAGRNIINTLHKLFLSAPKKAFRKARGGIIAATEGIRKEIRCWYGEESQVICEIGPPSTLAIDHSIRTAGEPLKLSWSGQHLPGKALPLLLGALARLPKDMRWHLDILGDGPCRKKWQRLALKLGINTKCTWHGLIPRSEAIDIVHQSHIFVITSLKDLTSTVLLEALSQGVPVVCPDHCGFGDIVDRSCGIKVPVTETRQLENDIAIAITSLAENEGHRRHLAASALQQTGKFAWDNKADEISSLYKRVLSKTTRL